MSDHEHDTGAERLSLGAGDRLPTDRLRSRLAVVLPLALVLSTVTCLTLAWQHRSDEPSPAMQHAASRDEARADSLRDLETLMSADHRDAAGTFESWTSVTTGRLHAQLAGKRKAIATRLGKTKEVTTVRTIDAALASWDEAAGTARLLAVLELKTSTDKKPVTRTVRYLAMTQRVDDEWRLSAVQQVGATS